jgi:PAS domain S-box-containing protein/putative nucleotidyltransferase with HDIG domain
MTGDKTIRVLCVEDNPHDLALIRDALERQAEGFTVVATTNREQFEEALATCDFDVVLTDFNILGFEGLQVIRAVREHCPEVPVVVVTGTGSEEIAVAAMKSGAADYVIKSPKHIRRLPQTILAVLEKARLEREYARAAKALQESEAKLRAILGAMPEVIVVYDAEGRYVEIAPTRPEQYYAPPEEVLGKTVHQVLPPEVADTILAAIGKALQRKEVVQVEYALPIAGRPKWFSASAAPLSENTVVWVAHDITARVRQQRILEAQARLARALSEAPTLQSLLEHILEAARHAIPAAQKGSVLLAEADGTLRIRALAGYQDMRLLGLSFPKDIGYASRAARLRQPLLVADVWEDPALRYFGDIEEARQIRSAIAVPMFRDRRLIGVISLDSESPGTFKPKDLDLLTSFAATAALVLERAHLFDESQRRLKQIHSLFEVSQTITGSLDLSTILNTILQAIRTELRVDAADVLLFDPSNLTLNYAAGQGFGVTTLQGIVLRLGQGFAGLVAQERRSIYHKHLAENPEFRQAASLRQEGLQYYYGIPLVAHGELQGVLEMYHRHPLDLTSERRFFIEAIARQAAIAIDNQRLVENLQRANLDLRLAYDATIEAWSRLLELRDLETKGHTLRVTELTLKLARAAGMSDDELVHVRRGALLHDIGKMAIPDSILLKPGKLTDDEWKIMKQHPQIAYDVLSPIPYLKPALDIPYCHHEKWDGTGYPRGLKGEQIPLAARIFAVVDVWDALRSDRPYRKAWPEEKVREYIKSLAGTHFDPKIVELFFQVLETT